MEAMSFEVEFTEAQREELGREAHAAALRHCSWESLYPAVRDAYCEQGVRVARLALLMAWSKAKAIPPVLAPPPPVHQVELQAESGPPAPAAVASPERPVKIAPSARVKPPQATPEKGLRATKKGTTKGKVLELINKRGQISRTELQVRFGITRGHADAILYQLRSCELIAPADGSGFAKSLAFAPTLAKTEPQARPVRKAAPPPAPKLEEQRPVAQPPAPRPPSPSVQPLEIDQITKRLDLFRCPPLRCTLTAGSCLDRQGKAHGARTGADSKALQSRKEANAYAVCKACAYGKRVAARLASPSA